MVLHFWSQFLFYGCLIALAFLPPAFSIDVDVHYAAYYFPTLAVLFLLRYVSQMIIYSGAVKRLGERGLLPPFSSQMARHRSAQCSTGGNPLLRLNRQDSTSG